MKSRTTSEIKLSVDDILFTKYNTTRDLEVRNTILEKYLYIAEIIAKKFANRGVEYDDLFQVASLALVKALERFEYNRGVKFASFATPTLIGEIKNYFRDKTRIVRISRRDSEQIKSMDEAKIFLTQKYRKSPSPKEISSYMNVSMERVLVLMETKSAGYTKSLEGYLASNDDTSLIQIMGIEDKEFARMEDNDFIKYCMDNATDIEKKIIKERFNNNKSQREVAQDMNVSQMYISRLERKILLKFRSFLEQ